MVMQPGVLIDACVPRDPYERCVHLFDELVAMSEVGPHGDLDPEQHRPIYIDHHDEFWTELEDSLLRQINAILPDNLVCTLGEYQPGDVIIREIGPDELDEG